MHAPQLPHRQSLRRSGRRGFTLLELILVLLVLAVLSAIAVPVYNTVKENSVERVVQTTLESIERNGEAIAVSDPNLTDDQIATAALAEVDPKDGMTITRNGSEITVEHTSGTITETGSVTFTDGVGEISGPSGGGGGGGSAFQAQTTDWSWNTPTVAAADVCPGAFFGFLTVAPATHPDLDSNIAGWEYSIDGASFSQWLPTQTNLKIWGGAGVGFIMFPDVSDPNWATDPAAAAMCSLTSGQQVQFKTPSGLYSQLLTIS